MRTLIIPDVHQRTAFVMDVLGREDYDEAVFLGDWLDSHIQPPLVSGFSETCRLLRDLVLGHPRRRDFVFLVGNHDIHYIWHNCARAHERLERNSPHFCSGVSRSKARVFRREFFERGLRDGFFLRHFKIAHRSQGFVFSHAGLIPSHLPAEEEVSHFVDISLPLIWQDFRRAGAGSPLARVGKCRGGSDEAGGVLWLDWRREFSASRKIGKQVVGHTSVASPEVLDKGGESESWNFDAAGFYGIVENGEVRVCGPQKQRTDGYLAGESQESREGVSK